MADFYLGKLSRENLRGVHSDLVILCALAIEVSTVDFRITEGYRSKARQEILFQQKKSLTRNSRHLYGLAVDVAALVGGAINWEWKNYEAIANAFYIASQKARIPVTWGGTFKRLKDGPHFELPRRQYPDGCWPPRNLWS